MRSSRPLFTGGMLALCLAGLHAGCAPEATSEENTAGSGGQHRTGAEAMRSPAAGGSGDPRTAGVPRASERPRGAVLRFDPARAAAPSMRIGGEEDYEASLARRADERWMAWLTHESRVGDSLHVARIEDDGRRVGSQRIAGPGMLANPRLTVERASAPDGTVTPSLFVSWEERSGPAERSSWAIHSVEVLGDGSLGSRLVISPTESSPSAVHVAHDVTALVGGGLRFAWRAAESRGFRIGTRSVASSSEGRAMGPITLLPTVGTGAWDPRIACDPEGVVAIAYEAFREGSFDVVYHRVDGQGVGPATVLAGGPRLQYHPRLIGLDGGGFLCAWEEGAEGWGAPFSARKEKVPGVLGKPSINELRFDRGPLHRLRALRFATIAPTGEVYALDDPFPLPAFSGLSGGQVRRGAEGLGGFYERAELKLDGRGRPWVVWRHYIVPELGYSRFIPHHVFDEGWRLYARAWTSAGWSQPFVLDRPQRDGGQSLSVIPSAAGDGLEILWSVGRHDRYRGVAPPGQAAGRDPERGLRLARVTESVGNAAPLTQGRRLAANEANNPSEGRLTSAADVIQPTPVQVGEQSYRLRFGDLHRHTDVSLCNAFLDGTLQDTYRYAIEASRLDFVAITDHTWDIDLGVGSGLTWWRGVKAVSRHRLPERFTPFHGFERSSGNTDHNFISLREDLIFDHPAQRKGGEKQLIEEVWRGLDERTLTLPHQPVRGKIWDAHDERRRPLMEVYQGFRTEDALADAEEGLGRGYRFGFVASSDHLSTSASYAGVWATENTPESIFAGLRERRTFAATVPMSLILRVGDTWMGERHAETPANVRVSVRGTANIARIKAVWSGAETTVVDLAGTQQMTYEGELPVPAGLPTGEQWVYVRIEQADGGLAWSSPLWFPVTD